MDRGIITISEMGIVMIPDVPVWMTLPEIADMLGVFECDVHKAIKSIYRNEELYEFETMKYVKQSDGISYDVCNLEMVIAVAFKIQSKGSRIFRQFLIERLYSGKDGNTIPSVYFIVHRDIFTPKGHIYN